MGGIYNIIKRYLCGFGVIHVSICFQSLRSCSTICSVFRNFFILQSSFLSSQLQKLAPNHQQKSTMIFKICVSGVSLTEPYSDIQGKQYRFITNKETGNSNMISSQPYCEIEELQLKFSLKKVVFEFFCWACVYSCV